MRVLDGAVCVLDGKPGREPHTETVGARATITACRDHLRQQDDKTGADFYMCVADIKDKLGARTVPLQPPIGAEAGFKGLVDLLRMKAIIWHGDEKDSKFTEEDIPADLADKAAEFRAQMIEAAVEMDDDAMAAYLDGKEPDVDTLKRLIRKATVKSVFYPMLCGSAFKYKGVQPCSTPWGLPPLAGVARPSGNRGEDRRTGGRRPVTPIPRPARLQDYDTPIRSITFSRFTGTVRRYGARQHPRDRRNVSAECI